MRCFIAIDIDEKTKAALGALQKELDTKSGIHKGDVKWVAPDNMHLTLKFLGEITDEQAGEVSNIVKDLADGYKSFTIDVESVGCFPHLGSLTGGGRSAKIVWVGTRTGRERLIALQKDLESRLTAAGFPPEEREFSAHLTLCRVNNPKAGVKLAQLTEAYRDYKIGSIGADAINVYQSQLTPQGPIYTLLASYKLS